MVRKKGSLILCGAFLFVAWNALLLLYLWGRPPIGRLGEGGGAEPGGKEEWGVGRGKGGQTNLAGEVIRLAEEVEVQLETQKKLLKQIESHRAVWVRQKDVGKREMDDTKVVKEYNANQPPKHLVSLKDNVGDAVQSELQHTQKPAHTITPDSKSGQRQIIEIKQEIIESNDLSTSVAPPEVVIPILVIACDRVTVKRSLDRLIQYRPSPELHPIIVSQTVTHISQPDLSDIRVRPEHRKFQGYYKIARHYRWALNQVFNTFSYSAVVIVEDDLEVAPDFFEYFRALYPILSSDPTLWCVSAWNDNGRDALKTAIKRSVKLEELLAAVSESSEEKVTSREESSVARRDEGKNCYQAQGALGDP
ncbi:hypothetical protein Q5P01_017912 [Channa striata]|uniref:Alpha-1,3-mannosyl-glycoprotein 2-beta-N-acetylglucosaminyltransferase n=1 Tax=Channa striata TaxID=64152 RepID=A0AA88M3Q4_CHASR|nr:hypothetical protein Q5P01_017912 [Channa striata]